MAKMVFYRKQLLTPGQYNVDGGGAVTLNFAAYENEEVIIVDTEVSGSGATTHTVNHNVTPAAPGVPIQPADQAAF